MRSGYIPLGRWRGVAVRLHWSAFACAAVLSLFRFWPVFWAATLVLLVGHAFGHALVARLCHLRVTAVDIDGTGGRCSWLADTTRRKRALIAWGGVCFQLAFLGATGLVVSLEGWPQHELVTQLVAAWTWGNAALIVVNLLPFRWFDGAEAWKLVPELVSGRRTLTWRQSLRDTFLSQPEPPLVELPEEEPLPPELRAQIDRIASGFRPKRPRKSKNRQ